MRLMLWPLCLIFYRKEPWFTNDGKPIYGEACGPFVWILEGTNAGVMAHELEHIRQAWRGLMIFHILFLNIPRYREWCESKAMAVQLEATRKSSH